MISVSKNSIFTILISKNRFSTLTILQTSTSETKKTIPRTIGMNSWGTLLTLRGGSLLTLRGGLVY